MRERVVRGERGTVHSEFRVAALKQVDVEQAAIGIVVCVVDEWTTQRDGDRG